MHRAARCRARRRARPHCTSREQPLDVLAQQIVAEVSAREYGEDELLAQLRRAWPYRDLARANTSRSCACWPRAFSRAAAGRARTCIATRVNHRLRARRGARLTAITCGGAIPYNADYQVVLEPDGHVRRHAERGLCRREPGRRHLPARQHVLPDPAGRGRTRARRRTRRAAAHDPVLAGRSARRAPPSCRRRYRAARGDRCSSCRRSIPRRSRRDRARHASGTVERTAAGRSSSTSRREGARSARSPRSRRS